MSWLALSALFEYLCYGSMVSIDVLPLQCDVYRRQILTSKDAPHAEWTNC